MPKFTDIRPRNPTLPKEEGGRQKFETLRQTQITHESKEKIVKKKIPWVLLVSFVIFVGLYGLKLLHIKDFITTSATNIKRQFKEISGLAQNLDIQKAGALLDSTVGDIDRLNEITRDEKVLKFSFQSIPAAIQSLADLGKSILAFGKGLDELSANSFRWMIRGEGAEFIRATRALKDGLDTISKSGDEFRDRISKLGYLLGNEYEKVNGQLFRSEQFLNAFLSWLETEDQHFLILFQNTSEIRPGGGFVGSYADLEIKRGSITNIDVRNIYDPDGQLAEKIIPPKPLQLITYSWGARDANWFFDFPTSARKIIRLLEMSKMYKKREIVFSGALAINVDVIANIIDVIGPIDLLEYEAKITGENFLDTIQKEVRSGKDRESGDAKRIIKILTPVLLERMSQLSENEKTGLLKVLKNGFVEKDLILYFKDLALESYFEGLGITGDIFEFPKNTNGDYLAIVNANIGGGKTDAVLKQHIKINSIIDLNGIATNRLFVEREHRGNLEQDWWYRMTNINYFQVLTPFGAILKSSTGIQKKDAPDPIDYRARGYIIDADVRINETSDSVFGKKVFSGWFNVPSGEKKQVTLEYEVPNAAKVADDTAYAFVFEKQSGVNTDFEVTIQAPIGYYWREKQSRNFSYYSADPPGRVTLNLILEKDDE